MTSARADYSNILPQKNKKIKIFLWRNRNIIGIGLMLVGFALIFIAVSNTDINVSIFWDISFGILGIATAFTGLHVLEPNRM